MSKWTIDDAPRLTGQVALVTGANSGLGFHTSAGLARRGAAVIMACRNPDKAEAARDRILAAVPGADLRLQALDLADLDSVRACAAQVSASVDRLDMLCNNAGIMAVPLAHTKAGFESQIGTNHFGHFALTGLLLPRLRATAGARVMNVSSMAHRWTPGINFDDLDWRSRNYRRWQAYGDSKLANLLFTFELKRRLDAAGIPVKAVAAHPGYSDTHLQYVAAEQKKSVLEKWVMAVSNALLAQPADMGALPSLYAATMPDVTSGDYIGPDGFRQTRGYPTKVGCRRAARDPATAARLWDVSEQRTGVTFEF